MTEFTRHTKQANCEACTLAEAMKDCSTCPFYIEYPRATQNDIDSMWKRLWHDLTPAQIHAEYSEGLLDFTQPAPDEWTIEEILEREG